MALVRTLVMPLAERRFGYVLPLILFSTFSSIGTIIALTASWQFLLRLLDFKMIMNLLFSERLACAYWILPYDNQICLASGLIYGGYDAFATPGLGTRLTNCVYKQKMIVV